MTRHLQEQRARQLQETITVSTEALEHTEAEVVGITLDHQDLSAKHHLRPQITSASIPRPDPDETRRAEAYRSGSIACTTLGVLVFALLGTLSLAFSVSPVVVFLGCALVGVLFGAVVNQLVCLATKANASNPDASYAIGVLAWISGILAIASALGFMTLRFVDNASALAFVSIILVCFESGVFLLGGALAGGHRIYCWSSRLALDYAVLRERRNRLKSQLEAAGSELEAINRSLKGTDFRSEGDPNHDKDVHRASSDLDVSGVGGVRPTININGASRKFENTDDVGRL
jgi:hypothetical protein